MTRKKLSAAALAACLMTFSLASAAQAEAPNSSWRHAAARLAANRVSVAQQGQNHAAAVVQAGQGNTAGIRQYGASNTGAIQQNGANNTACLIQLGRGLDGAIAQTGDNNSAGILQTRRGARDIPPEMCELTNGKRGAVRGLMAYAIRTSR